MMPYPGDVLAFQEPPTDLIVLVLRRYPIMYGEHLGEEVEILWLVGHTNEITSKHRAHPDTWDGWVKL